MVIQPRLLKGFRDFLPDQEVLRRALIRRLEDTFSGFGFVPIDTPVLEYTEVLLGKGGGETDKQVYRFTDHGSRDVSMRFDLTVPFARFMALHRNELHLPFRRFHISKVFRGENTQRGRYREFTQCDFDIVGTDALSTDLEIITMIDRAFAALEVPGVHIHISHRGIFNELLDRRGVREASEGVLRSVDKLRKIGREKTHAELDSLVGGSTAAAILAFIEIRGDMSTVLDRMEELLGEPTAHTARMRDIERALASLGLAERVVLDPSITRGLDYYTGIVFETFLDGMETIGSVCSGGRYDDLVSLYSKESMPGVGASIGLDRLIAGLQELDRLPPHRAAPHVLITMQDAALTAHYHALAAGLRDRGIACEVYPEERKLAQQFAFAERKGIPLALICGQAEYEADTVNLRVLADRSSEDGVPRPAAADRIAALVGLH